MGSDRDRQRAARIAYHALWSLRDHDPEGEPAYIAATRRHLRAFLDGDLPDSAATESPRRRRPAHLTVIAGGRSQ